MKIDTLKKPILIYVPIIPNFTNILLFAAYEIIVLFWKRYILCYAKLLNTTTTTTNSESRSYLKTNIFIC